MHEPPLGQHALCARLPLRPVVHADDADGRVVDRRNVLGRAGEPLESERPHGRCDKPRQADLRVARVPDAEDERGRRDAGQLGRVAGEHREKRLPEFREKCRAANEGVPGPVPDVEEIHLPLAGLHDDLGHEVTEALGLKEGLHPVGLRAHRVDEADAPSGRVGVDVVPARKSVTRGEGRRE